MTLSCGFAQNLNKKEAKALQTYLSQPSAKGGTNAQQLGVSAANPAAAQGLKIENGHVVEIDWKGKDLAGDLNLSGFVHSPALGFRRLSLIPTSVAASVGLRISFCTTVI